MSNYPKDKSCNKCKELSSRLAKLEKEMLYLKASQCTHGFNPGEHTQGIVGCEKCVGKRVMIWELKEDSNHSHSMF